MIPNRCRKDQEELRSGRQFQTKVTALHEQHASSFSSPKTAQPLAISITKNYLQAENAMSLAPQLGLCLAGAILLRLLVAVSPYSGAWSSCHKGAAAGAAAKILIKPADLVFPSPCLSEQASTRHQSMATMRHRDTGWSSRQTCPSNSGE